MFELFVARRYLRAKRKQMVISVITGISVAGVAAGVMALVIALAVNSGFRSTLERNLLAATAHVLILEKEPGAGIENWEQLAGTLSRLPHVASALPGLYEPGYLAGPLNDSGVQFKGVLIRPGVPVAALTHLKSGSIDGLTAKEGELPGIILGSRLAEHVGAVLGKPVTLLVPNADMTLLGLREKRTTLRVAGIFESGVYDFDLTWAFMSLPAAQKASGLSDVVNSIDLNLDDIYRSYEVAAAAAPLIQPKLEAITWQEENGHILNALSLERLGTAISIGLILLVAALNILIALVMMVMEKHRDIAILMSLGAKAHQIRRIFVWEGALIGAAGTMVGLAAGYTLCYFADRYQWLKLDAQVYGLAFVPFQAHWLDGLWIAAGAMAISLVATIYPARSATRIAPVEALRYE